MIFFNKKEKVRSFFYAKNFFFTSYENVLFCYDNKNKFQWKKDLLGHICNVFFSKERVYVEFFDKDTGFEKTSVIDVANGNYLTTTLHDFMLRDISYDGKAIALKYEKDFTSNTFLVDLKNEHILWKKNIKILPYFFDNATMLGGLNNHINCFNSDGEIIWTYDVSVLGTWLDYDKTEKAIQFVKIIGTYKEELYIYLNNGCILVLHSKTGRKETLISNDKNIHQGFFSGRFSSLIQLDRGSKKLIQFFRKEYTEVDLITKEVMQYSVEDTNLLGLENISTFVFDEEYIYFSDKNKGKLGTLKRKGLKINWTYELPQVEGKPLTYARSLKLKENYLYVQDNKNTLHIFQNLEE